MTCLQTIKYKELSSVSIT